jgi:hypothetical protein
VTDVNHYNLSTTFSVNPKVKIKLSRFTPKALGGEEI